MSEAQGAGISARRLLAWADAEEARRRRARAVGLGLPAWANAALVGALLAAEMWRRGADDLASASTLYTLGVAAAATLAAMGAPFRLYWRHDAALLARLPIPGGSLYRAAARRSARAGARVLAFALPGLVVLAVASGDLALALRHLALGAGGAAAAALLSPAAALAAGAMVASERAQAAVASLAGEVRAPPTAWLGMLPGLAAAAVALVILFAGGWANDGAPWTPVWLVFGLAAAGGAAHAWALRAAPTAMVAALREISALDRDRLAHVDKVGPSRLERLWGRVLVRRGNARAVYAKDATMLRRRYPMVYVGTAVGVGALWLVAATRPDEYVAWSVGILAAVGAYAAVVARRLWNPPVEHARYLRSLPVEDAGARSAKRAGATIRVVVPAVLGGAVFLARAPDPAAAGLALIVVIAASLAAAVVAGRPPR